MTETTRACTFTNSGYPTCLEQNLLPRPSDPPGPTQIRLRVHAAALNPVDIQIMNIPVWNYLPTLLAPAQKGVGRDFAGVIEAAGSESGFKAGDEVFGVSMSLTAGTLQGVTFIDTKAAALTLKPSQFSWTQAAALPLVYLTARTTIAEIEPWLLKPSGSSSSQPKVAILGGSSATGMYTVSLAAARGWNVISTCSARNRDFVLGRGASSVIDYTSTDVREAITNFAPDAIIDCVGGTECLGIANVKRYVTIVGDKTSRATMGGPLAMYMLPRMALRQLISKLGIGLERWLGSGESYAVVQLGLEKAWLEEVLEWRPEEVIIDSEFDLAQVKDAFERLNTGRARGKVVVRITDS